MATTKQRWWIPLRFLELAADPVVRRMEAGDRWSVLECLCDAWRAGALGDKPTYLGAHVWQAVERLWPTYAAELVRCEQVSEKRRKSAALRWDTIAQQKQSKPMQQSQSQSQTQPKNIVVRARRAPSGFQPDDQHRAIAAGRKVDLDQELAAFCDHEFAVPRSDWPAAFRNWLRRARAPLRAAPREHPTDARIRQLLGDPREIAI